MADEETINIPQLVVVLVLGGLAIKYFFFSQTTANSRPRTATIRAREQDVARVQEMFPQADRRSIMWDLQRNGGNVQATTERLMGNRGLEQPPVTFQPVMPMAAAAPSTSASSSTAAKAAQPDLIQRYNLGSKLTKKEDEEDALPSPSGKQAWSQNKAERQDVMKRRREEMILAARKKMEAKIAAEAATKKA